MLVSEDIEESTWLKVGKAIRKLRIDKDIKQSTLAKNAGISVSYVSQIEAGRDVPLGRLRSIARALGMTLSQLFEYANTDADLDLRMLSEAAAVLEQLAAVRRSLRADTN